MRSHTSSASAGPPSTTGRDWSRSSYLKEESLAPPRPTWGAVRRWPMMVTQYLTAGIPAREALRISWQICSISRSRSTDGPRRAWLPLSAAPDDEMGRLMMSRDMP